MTKVLFILSAVVIIVAGFFAFQNGREFAEVRSRIHGVNQSILAEKKTEQKGLKEVADVKSATEKVQADIDVEAEKLKAQRNKLSQTDSEVATTEEALAAKEKKKAEQDLQLEKLPKGMNPENMVESIQKMKKEMLEYQGQAEIKKKEVAAEEEKVAGIQKRLDEVNHKIEERRKNFERNSLTSRVIAVNYDWGFVIIDAGKSTGLTQDTKLIVTRGAQTVGKVSVMSVENKNSMAAIVPDTVVNGQVIMPGDRVILENLVQN
ncbi:hypothetical protein [Prosthecobacter sp.]|uniref:hypothetical protein n=1 Tax=Prosthecobacter sp. TaxID=1965333 RepID=UPI00378500C8